MINFKIKNEKIFTIEVGGLPAVDYVRDYECDFVSKTSIKIYNRYSKKELYRTLSVNDFTIDGVSVSTSQEAVSLLNNILYYSSNSGGTGGSSNIDYTAILNAIKLSVEKIDGDSDSLQPILGAVDELEALINRGNAEVSSIGAIVDNILTACTTVQFNTDELEAVVKSQLTLLTTLSNYVDNIEEYLISIDNKLHSLLVTKNSVQYPELTVISPDTTGSSFILNTLGKTSFIVKVIEGSANVDLRGDYNSTVTLTENSNLDTIDLSASGLVLGDCEVTVRLLPYSRAILYTTTQI